MEFFFLNNKSLAKPSKIYILGIYSEHLLRTSPLYLYSHILTYSTRWFSLFLFFFFFFFFVLIFDRGVEVEDVGSGFSCKNFLRISSSLDSDTTRKNSVFWVILVRIFSHSDSIWRVTKYLSVFSPNAGKCGLESLRIRELFTQWQ